MIIHYYIKLYVLQYKIFKHYLHRDILCPYEKCPAGGTTSRCQECLFKPLSARGLSILSLGIYFLCFPTVVKEQKLFPWSNQYERFRSILHRLLDRYLYKKLLMSFGVSSSTTGTHSIRKGASTFCSSGTTACPSSTAVHLRAGWALGGVQDTYLR